MRRPDYDETAGMMLHPLSVIEVFLSEWGLRFRRRIFDRESVWLRVAPQDSPFPNAVSPFERVATTPLETLSLLHADPTIRNVIIDPFLHLSGDRPHPDDPVELAQLLLSEFPGLRVAIDAG